MEEFSFPYYQYYWEEDIRYTADLSGLSDTATLIFSRAKKILCDRTHNEILNAAVALDWITSSIFRTPDPACITAIPMFYPGEDSKLEIMRMRDEDATQLEILYSFKDEIQIEHYDQFKNGEWPEYCAIIALAILSDAINELDEIDRMPKASRMRDAKWFNYSDLLASATAALIFGEGLRSTSNTGTDDSKRRNDKRVLSLQGHSAAIARHKPRSRIKTQFIKFCQAGTYASKAEAARSFYRSLEEEEKRILCPSLVERNAVRTLTSIIKHVTVPK